MPRQPRAPYTFNPNDQVGRNGNSFVAKIRREPRPLQHHAFNTRNGSRVYNPSHREQENFKAAVIQAKESIGMTWNNEAQVNEGPWEITVVFYFRKSSRSRITPQFIPGRSNAYCTTTPDIDNCLKFVMDALNGVAYRDDKQLVRATATKKWMQELDTDGCILLKVGPIDE